MARRAPPEGATRVAEWLPEEAGSLRYPQLTVGFHSKNMPLGLGFQTHAWSS
jgi:hypothetical protein